MYCFTSGYTVVSYMIGLKGEGGILAPESPPPKSASVLEQYVEVTDITQY